MSGSVGNPALLGLFRRIVSVGWRRLGTFGVTEQFFPSPGGNLGVAQQYVNGESLTDNTFDFLREQFPLPATEAIIVIGGYTEDQEIGEAASVDLIYQLRGPAPDFEVLFEISSGPVILDTILAPADPIPDPFPTVATLFINLTTGHATF